MTQLLNELMTRLFVEQPLASLGSAKNSKKKKRIVSVTSDIFCLANLRCLSQPKCTKFFSLFKLC